MTVLFFNIIFSVLNFQIITAWKNKLHWCFILLKTPNNNSIKKHSNYNNYNNKIFWSYKYNPVKTTSDNNSNMSALSKLLPLDFFYNSFYYHFNVTISPIWKLFINLKFYLRQSWWKIVLTFLNNNFDILNFVIIFSFLTLACKPWRHLCTPFKHGCHSAFFNTKTLKFGLFDMVCQK